MAISTKIKDRRGKPIIEGAWYWHFYPASGHCSGTGKFTFGHDNEPNGFFINGVQYTIDSGNYELADPPQPPDVPTSQELYFHALKTINSLTERLYNLPTMARSIVDALPISSCRSDEYEQLVERVRQILTRPPTPLASQSVEELMEEQDVIESDREEVRRFAEWLGQLPQRLGV